MDCTAADLAADSNLRSTTTAAVISAADSAAAALAAAALEAADLVLATNEDSAQAIAAEDTTAADEVDTAADEAVANSNGLAQSIAKTNSQEFKSINSVHRQSFRLPVFCFSENVPSLMMM